MTDLDLLTYLEKNYPSNKKENIFEWAEEALENLDVKVGMRDFTILKLEENLKILAESIVSAFRENRKVHIEDFNKAVDVLDDLKER
jgi:hypothetical protein